MTSSGTNALGRIAIVDDHELLLDGMTTWIRMNVEDLIVVTSVTSWVDFIRHPEFPPDVTVMDFQLKEPISIESRVRTCLAAGSRVVVVSALDTEDVRRRVLAAGADAFVAKSRSACAVADAVREAFHGRNVPLYENVENEGHTSKTQFGDEILAALQLYASGNSPVDIAVVMGLPFEYVKGLLATVREHYAEQGTSVATKQELIRHAAKDGYLI